MLTKYKIWHKTEENKCINNLNAKSNLMLIQGSHAWHEICFQVSQKILKKVLETLFKNWFTFASENDLQMLSIWHIYYVTIELTLQTKAAAGESKQISSTMNAIYYVITLWRHNYCPMLFVIIVMMTGFKDFIKLSDLLHKPILD